jgi:LCP family protein required for cell wall assembly
VAAAALTLGGLTAGALWSLHGNALAAISALSPPFGGRRRVNLLVLGVDDGQGGNGRSDTMLLVRVNTRTRRIAALSIPRDTRVGLGGDRIGKINAAYARGGPALAARAVSELTGVRVDHTIYTDFGGFKRVVDLAGGIDLEVERPMHYQDHWAGLKIDLEPGHQHLDGARAIQYVRFRKSNDGRDGGDGSDLSRIGRQQKFLAALAAHCLRGENLVRLPALVREVQRQLHTDLATSDLFYLAGLVKEIDSGRLNVLTVPGKTEMIDGQSYWLVDRQGLADVIRQWDGESPPAPGAMFVAVLNASRRRGLGRRVAAQLRRRGYQISRIASTEKAAERSRVLAADECRSGAEAIADVLNCQCAVGSLMPEAGRGAQVTVIVGRDFAAESESSQRG